MMESGYRVTSCLTRSRCVRCSNMDECCKRAASCCIRSEQPRCNSPLSSVDKLSLPAMSFILLKLCILVVLFGYSNAISNTERHNKEMKSKAVEYLAKFKYLSGPSQETGNLMSQKDMTRAIKNFQRVGQIPETGIVDQRTIELMQKPRCGNSDENIFEAVRRRRKRYLLAPTKWEKKNLTFKMINYTPDMRPEQVQTVIHSAFKVWSEATLLTFTEVMHGDADIMIQFASRYHQDGYPFDGKGMILAHAFFPGDGKGGDTHFDDDEHWTYNSSDGVDLFMVAAHEFGHALGLAHSTEPGALMYPWYQGFQKTFALPHDDIRGIQKLYGFKIMELPQKPTVKVVTNATVTKSKEPDEETPRVDIDTSKPADPCVHSFDAITVIRQEVCLFIGKFFWRLDSRHILRDPVHIHKFWYGLPVSVDHIDALYERPTDGKIVFFSGDKHWVFNANYLEAGYPKEGRPITELGIPPDVKKIDTVFVWGFNKRTYLVSGDMYWKLDENNTYVEYDYPRDMSIWRGIPIPIDAAFQYWDKKTYFFQGQNYYEFYDLKMRGRRGYPKSIAKDWLKCSGAQIQYSLPNRFQGAAPSISGHVILILSCLYFLYHQSH
ncbi:matrix metalloproteinase-17-like [Haliotis cracherodii]|uniref:matrix metalloproteinase-17-like n=1 Tax=Haliotis cracherodii TaxID=6455 RepID=UPI0039E9BF1F